MNASVVSRSRGAIGRRVFLCLAAGGLGLAASNGLAQLNYLSDTRTVSAAVRFNPLNWDYGNPSNIVSYSGDYSASANPTAPFADFGTTLNGTATLVTSVYGYQSTLSASVSAGQTSFLRPQELSYSSSVAESGSAMPDGYTESSFLQVSFSVSAPLAYSLTCQRGPDPAFSNETWSLASANQGQLLSSPTSPGPPGWDGPFDYSGTFLPGDVYTLTLNETGGAVMPNSFDAGGLSVDLVAAPEPSTLALEALGLALLLGRGGRLTRR
ncbi:MAG TPA: hypothetical protein VMU04_08650 [Candidatus Acidoferrum sp.]|nr:hypothetical protein [Candidatus Acidoferrum sp.]